MVEVSKWQLKEEQPGKRQQPQPGADLTPARQLPAGADLNRVSQ